MNMDIKNSLLLSALSIALLGSSALANAADCRMGSNDCAPHGYCSYDFNGNRACSSPINNPKTAPARTRNQNRYGDPAKYLAASLETFMT